MVADRNDSSADPAAATSDQGLDVEALIELKVAAEVEKRMENCTCGCGGLQAQVEQNTASIQGLVTVAGAKTVALAAENRLLRQCLAVVRSVADEGLIRP